MNNINIFDILYDNFKITKPIRLIELFAGIGSQAKALERLNVDFEHYKVCEYDKYAIQSYNAIHGTNFKTSDITKIHAKDLNIIQTYIYIYIDILFSLSRLVKCRE
jgi:DNA (cytosine-5)-methyltransferase 1